MTQITAADLDNAKSDVDTIANIANSTSTSVTDRLGNTRRTLYSLANEFPNASDNAAAAAASAIAAEAARDAALIQAGVYTTEALGRAAVADGQAFKVQGSGNVAAYEYRRTNSTTSVLIATYPSESGIFMFRGVVTSGVDLNSLHEIGSYGLLAASTHANIPPELVSHNCTLTVTDSHTSGGRFQIQEITDWNFPSIKLSRLSDGASSGAWQRVAVTTSQITDNAITTAKIADLAVTNAKLAVNYDYTSTITTGSLDDYLTSSSGYIIAGTVTNSPTASGFLSVHRWGSSGQFVLQSYVDLTVAGRIYHRVYSGAWGAWYQPTPADVSVTTAKIVDSAVTTAKIVDSAVTTAKIADGSVTNAKLAVNYDYTSTITTGSLDDYLTSSSGYIIAGTVTNAPTVSGFLSVHRWGSAGQFVLQSYVDLTVAGRIYHRVYSGGAWGAWHQPTPADLSVTTAKLADGSVTSTKLADASVTNAKLAANYDYTATITSGSLDTYLSSGGYVIAGTVTNSPTASGFLSVHRWGSAGQFVLQRYVDLTTPRRIYHRAYSGGTWGAWHQPTPDDLSLTTAKFADGAVTTPKLADASVDATKLSTKYDWMATLVSGDVNDYTTQSGGWMVAGAMTNAPTGSGWLFVHKFGASGNFTLQRWYDFTNPSIFWVRKNFNGTWSAWSKLTQPQVLPKTGKNVICLGDSITENGDYPVRLATLTGATVTNCGFGGSRLAFSTGDYAYLSFHKLADYISTGDYSDLTAACARLAGSPTFDDNIAIAARLAAVNWSTVDYIVAAYGTNDYGSPDVPLGTTTDTTGATFKGAINYAVNKICTAYPNIKILFVSPIWRSRYNSGDGNDSDTYANSRGNYLLEFVDAMKEMSALNKMPCIDMYRTSGINKYNGATLLSDGLHPVAGVGYQRIAEKIAAGLVANW